MKVVKKDIVHGKAGKCVKHPADHGKIRRFDVAPQVKVAGHGGKAEFQHEQRAHQVGNRFAGKGQRQPEKRAPQQVERIGANKIGAQVGCPAPTDITAADCIVAHLVKRHLLNIKIAVE